MSLILLPSRRGYMLGDEAVDGFADRRELDETQRRRIAGWAARFAPEQLDDAQRALLDSVASEDRKPDALTSALIADRQELQQLHLAGLLEELDEAQRTLLAHPNSHEQLSGARYPLSVGELAVLSDSSEDQLRRWADSGLLPSHRVGVERRFGRAAVARAMLLAQSSKPEKAVLALVSQGEGRRVMLMINAVLGDALRRSELLAEDERAQLATTLRRAANGLTPSKPGRPPKRPGRPAKRDQPSGVMLEVLPKENGWAVREPGGKVLLVKSLQKDAVGAARERLRESGGEVRVQGRRATRSVPVKAAQPAKAVTAEA
jgi:DNA-binding transcriptional MerR regulator